MIKFNIFINSKIDKTPNIIKQKTKNKLNFIIK